MAWETLTPQPGARGAKAHRRVTIAYRRHSGGATHAMAITMSGMLSKEMGWTPKDRVISQIDRAAGLLRLALTDGAEGWKLSGKDAGGMTCAYLRWPSLPEGETYAAEPADWRIEDGALIVTLPAWVFPAAQAKAPPTVAPPAAAPVARPAPPPARMTPQQEKAEAISLLEAGMSARAVSDDMGLPLGDVATWAAEVRQRQAKAA